MWRYKAHKLLICSCPHLDVDRHEQGPGAILTALAGAPPSGDREGLGWGVGVSDTFSGGVVSSCGCLYYLQAYEWLQRQRQGFLPCRCFSFLPNSPP